MATGVSHHPHLVAKSILLGVLVLLLGSFVTGTYVVTSPKGNAWVSKLFPTPSSVPATKSIPTKPKPAKKSEETITLTKKDLNAAIEKAVGLGFDKGVEAQKQVQAQEERGRDRSTAEDAKEVINAFMRACRQGDEATALTYLTPALGGRTIFGTNVAGIFCANRPPDWTIKAYERCGSTFRADINIKEKDPNTHAPTKELQHFTLLLYTDGEGNKIWKINQLNDW